MSLSAALIAVIASLVIAVGLVSLTTQKLFKSISASPKSQTSNFAGRTVSYGLSVVWVIWALGLGLFVLLGERYSLEYLLFPVPETVALVLLAVLIGFFDDVYGDKGSQGFKGHLRALARGEFTTGAMKLFFISSGSFIFAWLYYPRISLGALSPADSSWQSILERGGYALLAGAVIALACNFINLTDLRPGRASKVSLLLFALSLLTITLSLVFTSFTSKSLEIAGLSLALALVNALWFLSPILATLKLDLGEKGMLGDAGANGLGVLVGISLIVACRLNFVALGSLLVALLFLNALSEKISFSKLIEENPLLKLIDSWGRLKDK